MATTTETTITPVTVSNSYNSTTAPKNPVLVGKHANAKLQDWPEPPKFEDKYEERTYLKGRLALAFRIFGKLGFDEGVAGHITMRDPVDKNTFWVNPWSVAFSMIKSSDLILVDHNAKVIDGGECRLLNKAAFMIHAAIHEARPDVLCAAHTHSIHGRAFCALGRELDMITQDSCAFYDDHVVYGEFNGVVLDKEEGHAIARTLGNKKAALMRNHGLLTVGQTIEATIFWFMSLEKCCYAQLMVDAATKGRGEQAVKISNVDARFSYETVGIPVAGWFSGKPTFDVMAKESGDEYLQ